MPGTGWPEPGGFLPREALKMVGLVAAEGLCGMEIVEVRAQHATHTGEEPATRRRASANVGCPGYSSGGLESLVIFDDPAARLIHGDLSVADPPSSTFSTVSFGAYCARGVFGF